MVRISEVVTAAGQAAESGKYKAVFLNRSWNTVNHTMKKEYTNLSKCRPDLIMVTHNGDLHSIEVASKTDRVKNLAKRNNIPGVNKNYGVLEHSHYNGEGEILNKSGYSELMNNGGNKICG